MGSGGKSRGPLSGHGAGYDVVSVTAPEATGQLPRQKPFDLVILDITLAVGRAIARLRVDDADRPVLVLVPSQRPIEEWSADIGVPRGDLVPKPAPGNALVVAASRAIDAAAQVRRLRREGRPDGFDGLMGESTSRREKLRQAERLAHCDETACLLGETGTGKSRLAEAIHRAGPRSGHPFITAIIAPRPSRAAARRTLRPRHRGVHRSAPAARRVFPFSAERYAVPG
jgi:DNA-binding NtrC family response regulator